MLIHPDKIIHHLASYGIRVLGAFHIGAHDCEEMPFYRNLGLTESQVIWVDALSEKVAECRLRGFVNVYQAVMSDVAGQSVVFHVSNNLQSSSILDLKTHLIEHPQVFYVEDRILVTETVDDFFGKLGMNTSLINFWNLDIQGAELMVLRGATESLKHVDALYLEVNERELYRGCALLPEMDEFLQNLGFQRVETCLTHHGWGDALYLRNSNT